MRLIDAEYLKEHVFACATNGRPLHHMELSELFDAIDDAPTIEPELCEDAVSRADVEAEIANILKGVFVEYQDIAKKAAAKLPSVTPERKTGKWIEQDDGWDGVYYECSVCKEAFTLIDGNPSDNLYNFCPNCGADMRGGQK